MANNLKKIREAQGLSQSELSKRSGVSRPTIIKIETEDEPNVKAKTLVALADALGCSVTEIFFASV